jgi:hypothetical protein
VHYYISIVTNVWRYVMAGKKPAKVNSTIKKEIVVLPGKAVYFMGLMTEGFTCPVCKRNLIKGIIYEHEGSSYCKRGCIPKLEKAEAA